MNNPGNDQNPPEPPAADGTPPAPAEDLELTAPRECPDCRPGALDPLRCRAEGVKEQAAYDEKHKDGPSPEQYETARLQYGKARHDAAPLVKAARDKLDHAFDQLRCIIDDSETVDCLDDAWHHVKRRLEVCDPQLGCCVDDEGDFDADVDDCGTEIVKARIAEYEHRAQEAEDCFKKLLGEPAALTERVSNLQAEVDAVEAEVGTTEAKSLYARALVARRHLEEIWWGFDHPHDYVDCVCRALRISLLARAALSELSGELAVRACRQKARRDRCEHLRAKIAEGIIEEYVRRCHPRHRHDDDDDEHRHHRHHGDDRDDDDRDDDEDDDRARRRRDRDDRDRDDRDRDDRDDRDSYRDRGRRDQEYGRRRDGDRDRGYRRDRDRDRDDDRDRDRRDRDSYRDRS